MRNNSPEVFKYIKHPSNRRVKSEVPDHFKKSSNSSVQNSEDKSPLIHASCDFFKFSNSTDGLLAKHREVILDLLKLSPNLSEDLIKKLKSLTSIPDLLTDIIYHKVRTYLSFPISKDKYKDELAESKKYVSNLQTQLLKVKQSNNELTNMLLSSEHQEKLNKDLNESISLITSINVARPISRPKKRISITTRLDYDKILYVAQTAREPDGLKALSEEVRRSILADNILILTPNTQNTHFFGVVNGENIRISAKATVLSSIFLTGQMVSAKMGDSHFDPRIQQALKMKVKAFSAGCIMDHLGHKLGLLLILRKRPELLYERELGNLINIFSLYIMRWKLFDYTQKQENKVDKILEAVNEMLNSKILTDFLRELQIRLPDIFNCERANILLFDYEKNNLFRKTPSGSYDNFPIFHGLSGHCANTKKPLICNEVLADKLFHKEMDDPLGDNTKSILSVPLFSKVYENIPEAVLQVINKTDGSYFTLIDQENFVKISKMVTNCLIVLKYSQLSANMVDLIKRLEESLDKIHHEMSTMQYDFGSVKSSIIVFRNFINKNFG